MKKLLVDICATIMAVFAIIALIIAVVWDYGISQTNSTAVDKVLSLIEKLLPKEGEHDVMA